MNTHGEDRLVAEEGQDEPPEICSADTVVTRDEEQHGKERDAKDAEGMAAGGELPCSVEGGIQPRTGQEAQDDQRGKRHKIQ